ncbi:MAG TPA: hypothetical protein VFZ36_00685 [Vicinamibacterales bacterium]
MQTLSGSQRGARLRKIGPEPAGGIGPWGAEAWGEGACCAEARGEGPWGAEA